MTSSSERQGWNYPERGVLLSGVILAGIALLPLFSVKIGAQSTSPAYTVLYAFTGGVDGSQPDAALIRDGAGNLYGTTYGGGNTSGSCFFGPIGCGVVFKLDTEGHETPLYTFTGGTDGANPEAPLIQDQAGNLYGTTRGGGDTSSSCPSGAEGCGVVFELPVVGGEKVLYTFSGGTDGSEPAGLVRDAAGNLYGTTFAGGNTSSSCPLGSQGCGVVFTLDPFGNEKTLYTFTGGKDGATPEESLIRDAAGNLYGTTLYGGNSSTSCPSGSLGCGVVFKLDAQGHESVLYRFSGGTDGANPAAGLVRDTAGNLYGTTANGGDTGDSCLGSPGCGVIFKLSATRHETVLYRFTGKTDGGLPLAGVIRDPAGNLYGTTELGGNTSSSCPLGSDGCGVVFRLDASRHEKVLYTLTGGTDGAFPGASLIRDASGNFYGTAYGGGNAGSSCPAGVQGCGVIFRLR